MVIVLIRSISQMQVTESPGPMGYSIMPALCLFSLSSPLTLLLSDAGMVLSKPHFTDFLPAGFL